MSNTLQRLNSSLQSPRSTEANPGSRSSANSIPLLPANSGSRPTVAGARVQSRVSLSNEARIKDTFAELSGRDLAAQFLSANAPKQMRNGNSQVAGVLGQAPMSGEAPDKEFEDDSIFAELDGVEGLPESPLDSGDIHVEPPTGEPESVKAPNGEGVQVATYEDGTVVETGSQDGQEYQTTIVKDDDGTTTSTTTYIKDGKTYTNTTQQTPDGTRTEVYDVATGDVIERTERVTETNDDSLYDQHPGTGFALIHEYADGQHDPSTVVSTRAGVIDNGQNPPTYRPVSESTEVSTRIPGQFKDGSSFDLGDLGRNFSTQVDVGRDVDVHQQDSGIYFTTSETKVYDESGNLVNKIEVHGTETRVVGRDAEGVEVYLSESTVETIDENDSTKSTLSEHRGAYTPEQALAQSGGGSEQHQQRLEEGLGPDDHGYVDYRYNRIATSDGMVYVTEVGDYDDPDSDGRTVTTISNGNDESQVTYRNVYNDGHNVDTQSTYPGSELTDVTKSVFNDDGSYHVDSYTENGGERVSETVRAGQVVDPSEVSKDINGQAREDFLEGVEGTIIEETSKTTTYEDGKPIVEEAVSYQATGSPANLQAINGPNGQLTAVNDGTTTYAVDGQGQRFEVTANGEVMVDGEKVLNGGAPFTVPVGDSVSAIGTLSATMEEMEKAGRLSGSSADFVKRFSKSADVLGPIFSYIDIGTNYLEGDGWGTLEAVADGAEDINAVGTALGLSKTALKRLNVVGGVLNLGLAVRDYNNGNYVDCGLKVATGAGLILLATPAAPFGAALLISAGLFELGQLLVGGEDAEEPALVV